MFEIDYEHDFLKKQIIAYIGNKRLLLPLIYKAIQHCYQGGTPAHLTFVDFFSGSGVVSRFARLLGFSVISNDWEPFTFYINKGYLEVQQKDLNKMYKRFGGIEGVIQHLNSLPDPPILNQYIARYYSAAENDIEKTDFSRERLFYTRNNGLIIDKVRNEIEKLYPETSESRDQYREKCLLIGLLLYKAATHTNTSGVFKAYHKGFGGHNRDALRRILNTIKMERPILIDSPARSEVTKCDANQLARFLNTRSIDIVYLDPPYNQHQYGSNYHLLNTIALWDKPFVSNELDTNGILKKKAAIRKDWILTKSDYCYPKSAQTALTDLFSKINARYILFSYSTEGLIPFETLKKICAEKGKLHIVSNEYVKYRGGKQSATRINKNIEFVLIIDTENKPTKKSMREIDHILAEKKLSLFFNKKYKKSELAKNFEIDEASKTLSLGFPNKDITIYTRDFFELIAIQPADRLGVGELSILAEKLESGICKNKDEELQELLEKVQSSEDRVYFLKKVPHVLKKIAHKKYKASFYHWLKTIKKLEALDKLAYSSIEKKIDEIEHLAQKRFTN